ncbi:EscU/YscU/HrcU family type III secretion system export apparatus switch protein [Petroclostridium sp. X23]|uniref:EscU/YscU/HrcU family type III secretion system export apparatus switch protein n=1 Tax=Petroclostridium sp. X23 TaxID=3045146 RepID=UPI0024AE6094|nr:EscU/YscU/HrcU family type III secretion system export apparatus switch protein [Petroclostridium sp. X23]WHH59431.1 EscU/YscU/HrcU family type III secretion system export apparatus switch protein [Petroclostridium sp. X23]
MRKDKDTMKKAAAIKYDPASGDKAPKVIASGKGRIAESIIEKAEENNIPVHKDPKLAHMLNLLQIGDEIPPELYEVVAQILIFVSDLDKLRGEVKKHDSL